MVQLGGLSLLALLAATSVAAETVIISDPEDYSEDEMLQQVFGTRRQQKDVMMEFMIVLDGEKLGQALAKVGKERKIFATSLRELLQDYLLDEEIEKISGDSEGFISFERLAELQLETSINQRTMNIEMKAPVEKKKIRSLGKRFERGREKPNVKNAIFSGMMAARAAQSVQKHSSGDTRSTNLILSPTINFNGVALEGEASLDRSSSGTSGGRSSQSKFHRAYTSIVYDMPDYDINIRGGDVFSYSNSYQNVPRVVGLSLRKGAQTTSVENFNSGMQVTLLRASRIEIYINDALVRVKECVAPGTYILDDIPYIYGSNDVKVKIIDDTGREKILTSSSFLDGAFVAPWNFAYGVTAGYPEVNDKVNGRYDRQNPVVSANVQFGIYDATDLLLGVLHNKTGDVFNAELRHKNSLGLFEFRCAKSKYRLEQVAICGNARHLSYFTPSITIVKSSISFGVSMETTDKFFFPYLSNTQSQFNLGDVLSQQENTKERNRTLQYHAYVSDLFGMSVSFDYKIRKRPEQKDEKSTSFNIFRSFSLDGDIFSNAYVHLSYERIRIAPDRRDRTLSLNCSLSFRNDMSISSSYSKSDSVVSRNLSLSKNSNNDGLGYTISSSRSDKRSTNSVNANYCHSRFTGNLNLSKSSQSDQSAQIGVESCLFFADSTFAVGRSQIGDGGFVIVKPAESLEKYGVKLQNSVAESGALGGAVMPTSRRCVSSARLDTRKLPSNIEAKDHVVTALGEYRRGAVFEVRADGNYAAKGYLVDSSGEPYQLASAYAIREDNKNAVPLPFFTNSSGRFILTNLNVGKYRISVNVDGCRDVYLEIKESKEKIIDLGNIVCGDPIDDNQ
jgi:outer membrane usher protein